MPILAARHEMHAMTSKRASGDGQLNRLQRFRTLSPHRLLMTGAARQEWDPDSARGSDQPPRSVPLPNEQDSSLHQSLKTSRASMAFQAALRFCVRVAE